MSDKGWKKKRSKKYYLPPTKRRKRNFILEPDLKGFIVTCNNRERDCIREAYNLLNEFADKLYGSEVKEEDGSDADSNIEDALKKEVDSIKSISERRFQVVESGVKNCLFIRTKIEDPCHLMYAILSDIEECKAQRTKYLLRMLPVSRTCRAYIDDIKKAVDALITDFFANCGETLPTYAITYKIRNCTRLKREDLLAPLVELIQSKNFSTTADLKNPDVVINAEIICNICCLSILKGYYKYNRYNLVEFAAKVQKNAEVEEKEKMASSGDVKECEDLNAVASEEVSNEGDSASGGSKDDVEAVEEEKEIKTVADDSVPKEAVEVKEEEDDAIEK